MGKEFFHDIIISYPMDINDKIGAIIHKVDELNRRIDDLEKHDKKSWVFSSKIIKRSIGIWFDLLFLIFIFTFIAFGIYGLITIFGGAGEDIVELQNNV
jgi:hypothetical protein